MQYDIYFHCELAENVSQEDAIRNLQKITGLAPTKIEDHFFAGKSVSIKCNLSHKQAKDYSTRLAQAGLITEIRTRDAETTATAPEPAATLKQESIPTPKPSAQQSEFAPPSIPKKRNLLVYGTAICVAFIAVLGVGVWLYSRSLLDYSVPHQVKTAEAVLLNDKPIAIGHANIDKLVEIERLVKGFSREEALPAPDADGLLGKLLNAGVDLRQSLHQVVFSLSIDQAGENAEAYLNNILIGEFKQQQILAFLQQHYEVTNRSHEGKTYYEFTRQIRTTCDYTPSRTLAFGQGFIVISKGEKVLALVDAMNNPSAELAETNTEWVKYRNDHLVSIGVLQPEHLDKNDSLRDVIFFSGLSGVLPSVDGFFVGLAGTVIPPKVVIDATVISKDQQWLTTSEASLNADLLAAKQRNQSSKLLSAIINNLDIKSEPENLHLAFSIDNQLTDLVKQAIEEGLGPLFSISIGNRKGEVLPEDLDENPQIYQSVTPASLAQLPEFKKPSNHMIPWQQGPVAVRIIGLHHGADDIQEINLEAVTSEIPNTASRSFASASQLHIDDITNANGESLMDPATCGEYINSDPVVLTDKYGKGELIASKKIRLKPGAKIADITSIKGRINLNIATQVESQHFSAPVDHAIVKTQGAYLRIKEIAGNEVSYLLSGTKQPLLNVRGLNTKGQYLSWSGSSSYGSFGSGARSHNTSYRGLVNTVEVTYATQRHTQEYVFDITDLSPPINTNSFSSEHTPPVAYDMADWEHVEQLSQKDYPQDQFTFWFGQPVAVTRSGPVQTYLFKPKLEQFGPERSFNSHIGVNLPFIRSLVKSSGYLSLDIHSLVFDNGEQIKLTDTPWVSPITLDYKGGWLSESDEVLREKSYLSGSVDIKYMLDDATYEKVKGSELVSLNGKLSLALPTQIKVTSVPALQLGEKTTLSGFDLQFIKLEGNLQSYSINGDESALVAIYALNSKGKEIAKLDTFGDEFGAPSELKRRVADMRVQEEIDQLVVYEVADVVRKQFPLVLNIDNTE